jgi:DNA-binding Xre family transcriptional regulator
VEIAKIMARKRIGSRGELAQRIGVPATTIRRVFNDQWDGEASGPVVRAICRELNVNFQRIIRDPRHW